MPCCCRSNIGLIGIEIDCIKHRSWFGCRWWWRWWRWWRWRWWRWWRWWQVVEVEEVAVVVVVWVVLVPVVAGNLRPL